MKKIEEYLMIQVTRYVADNYEGLYEIYVTQVNQDEMSFDEFCVKMFMNNLKNKSDD
jgi:hypothetical protein